MKGYMQYPFVLPASRTTDMDNCCFKMKIDREQKIAFARIITDLIEADFVVEPDEMQFFENIISKEVFSISDTMLSEAKKMDFAKALSKQQNCFHCWCRQNEFQVVSKRRICERFWIYCHQSWRYRLRR